MDPEKRRFFEVALTDIPETYQAIDELMGVDSEHRKEHLESGLYKDAILEVIEERVELHRALLVKFLAYAHEVVEDRALPEEDGLKPVQRRIMYTCHQLDLSPSAHYRKSSKIVGDVVGDYHPHGNESIYQAMVKMAQPFNYRYPLIDGQGNWGSIDGDSPAHMRYTEARLTSFGVYLLSDLELDTVEWKDNYDNTKKEPKTLPPTLNVLLNGSRGIAVGMNTNIPPHNLVEVVEAAIFLIENPMVDLEELMTALPLAPDFPTGGEILDSAQLKEIYLSGEGTFYVRARAEIIKNNLGKADTIRIYEIKVGFKVAKADLIKNIGEIIKEKK